MKKHFNDAFWRWFGDSKVVDENGNPQVVYHCTTKKFNQFDIDLCGLGCHFGTKAQSLDILKRDKEKGRLGGKIKMYYLAIKKPFRISDAYNWSPYDIIEKLDVKISEIEFLHNPESKFEYLRSIIKSKGYDGLVYLNRAEGLSEKELKNAVHKGIISFRLANELPESEFRKLFPSAKDSWVAFSPEQIKSIDNDSTWNSDDPNVRSNPSLEAQAEKILRGSV